MSDASYKRLIKAVALLSWASVLLVSATLVDGGGASPQDKIIASAMAIVSLIGCLATAIAHVSPRELTKKWSWKVVMMLIGATPMLCLLLLLVSLWTRILRFQGYEGVTIFVVSVLICIPFFVVFLISSFSIFSFKNTD
jgi:hypothetical protein